jgi:hypothetical protein
MMQHDMQQMSAEMQRYIQECLNCHAVCVETAAYCLQMGGQHAEASHIRGLNDCDQICVTSADFMLRMSPLHPQTCGVCAQACEQCARSCEQFVNDAMMQRCAEACRSCAQSCREMARM